MFMSPGRNMLPARAITRSSGAISTQSQRREFFRDDGGGPVTNDLQVHPERGEDVRKTGTYADVNRCR